MTLIEAIKFDQYDGKMYVVASILVSDNSLVEHSARMLKLQHDAKTIVTTKVSLRKK